MASPAINKKQKDYFEFRIKKIILAMDTAKRVAPPITFAYCFGLQNLRCHIYYRAIKIKWYRGPHALSSVHCPIKLSRQTRSFMESQAFLLLLSFCGLLKAKFTWRKILVGFLNLVLLSVWVILPKQTEFQKLFTDKHKLGYAQSTKMLCDLKCQQ